jgi:hypothetical protein
LLLIAETRVDRWERHGRLLLAESCRVRFHSFESNRRDFCSVAMDDGGLVDSISPVYLR